MTAPIDDRPARARALDRYRAYWSPVDPAGVIVTDRSAEVTVAASAVRSHAGATAALGRLGAGQFHDGRLWQVTEAAADLPGGLTDDPALWDEPDALMEMDLGLLVAGCHARAHWVARATGYQVSWVAEVVGGRLADGDTTGWYAARVAAAAEARRLVRAELAVLERLGVDTSALTLPDTTSHLLDLVALAARAVGREVALGDLSGASAAVEHLLGITEHLGVPREEAREVIAGHYATGGRAAVT